MELLPVEANDQTTVPVLDILEQHPITDVMRCLTTTGRQTVRLLDVGCIPELENGLNTTGKQ